MRYTSAIFLALLLVACALIGAPREPVSATGICPGACEFYTPQPPATAPYLTNSRADTNASGCQSNNTIELNHGPVPRQNDLIVIIVESSTLTANPFSVPPSGFTLKDSNAQFNETEWYRVANGNEGSTFTVPSTCASGNFFYVIYVVTNESPSAPFDLHTMTAATLNGTTGPFCAASVSSTKLNDLPISVLMDGNTSQTISATTPTSLTVPRGAVNSGNLLHFLLLDNPVTTAGTYQACMTMSATNSFAHQVQVTDAIAPVNAIATPTPTPTPTPPPSNYVYHGCTVFPGSTIMEPPLTADTNSSKIIAHIPDGTLGDGGNTAPDERVNLATNATATGLVASNGWRTYPVAKPGGPDNTSPGATVPWQTGYFIESLSDGHGMVLNTDTCTFTEMFQTVWTGTQLKAYAGQQYVLANAYYPEFGPTQVTHLALVATTDFGEDAALASINHPLGMLIPDSAVSANHYTNDASNGEGNGTCGTDTTQCIVGGDRLFLSLSFTCPKTPASIVAMCAQLQDEGLIYVDEASSYGVRLALDTNGTDDWGTTALNFLKTVHIHDLYVGTRGVIH